MEHHILLNDQELTFSKNLFANHPEGTMVLDVTVEALCRWVVGFYDAEPALSKPLAEQPNLSDDTVCSVTFTLLFGEAVERLNVARLLLHTGHQSRAIASCRDSIEALQWAHIASKIPNQARKWMKGKKITAPRDLMMPPHVSNELRNDIAHIFNAYGTHPYREAVYLSLSVLEGQPAEVQEGMRSNLAENLGRLISTSGLVAAYCLDQFPTLQSQATLAIIKAVETISGKLLGIKPNLRDPMLSGYQASF